MEVLISSKRIENLSSFAPRLAKIEIPEKNFNFFSKFWKKITICFSSVLKSSLQQLLLGSPWLPEEDERAPKRKYTKRKIFPGLQISVVRMGISQNTSLEFVDFKILQDTSKQGNRFNDSCFVTMETLWRTTQQGISESVLTYFEWIITLVEFSWDAFPVEAVTIVRRIPHYSDFFSVSELFFSIYFIDMHFIFHLLCVISESVRNFLVQQLEMWSEEEKEKERKRRKRRDQRKEEEE